MAALRWVPSGCSLHTQESGNLQGALANVALRVADVLEAAQKHSAAQVRRSRMADRERNASGRKSDRDLSREAMGHVFHSSVMTSVPLGSLSTVR